jgi:hypothetical protein
VASGNWYVYADSGVAAGVSYVALQGKIAGEKPAAGPFTEAAANAWISQHQGTTTGGGAGASSTCAWFMVPPSTWQQVLNGLEHIVSPLGSTEIAVATYACGTKAQKLRAAGFQSYASKQAAENAVTGANNAANKPDLSSGIGLWIVRIGEGLLGIVLIGIGVARFTGTQNAVSQIVKARIP